jgi:hypothetical protein
MADGGNDCPWQLAKVAFFSGLGVAVSLMDDQMSSLVGVAISASLLPPAVNAGILWLAYFFQSRDWLGTNPPIGNLPADDDLIEEIRAGDDPDFEDYSDFRNAGIISLSLTVANIALLMLSSMLMFRIKEVSHHLN